ncbi:MCE family protein [filamentous cyanobacterium CCP5]|nr:MCE family protein [filamentous cyanobacterium CCP5]
MRARTIREGSVGLLILVGVALFGGLVLWLRGLNPGQRNYRIVLRFENTLGMQAGTSVRYRGVPVGRVLSIDPNTNFVDVFAEITQQGLLIPRDAVIETNQSGLIGETTIDITPKAELDEETLALSPFGEECVPSLIVCDGDRVQGEIGVSYESLLRSADELANALADPELVADFKQSLKNATRLTERAVVLIEDLRNLSRVFEEEVPPVAASIRRATNEVGDAAAQIELTAIDVNNLIDVNRHSIVHTLDNLSRGSEELQTILATVTPQIRNSQVLENLELLSANAAEAAVNIRQISGAVNTPENLILLQQTLESARSVFQNAQKVLADVDELTGDPALRLDLRQLINGLTDLVSSTEGLEQEMQVAQMIAYSRQSLATLTLTPAAQSANSGQPVLSYNGRPYRLGVVANPEE